MVGGSWRWSPTKVATPSFLIFIKGTNTASSVVCPASSMRTHPKSLPCKTGWSAPAQVLQTTSASSKIARWCARWPLSSLWSAALASCKFCCRSHAPMKTKLNILQERICTESFMHSFNLFFFQKWRNPSLTISSKLYFSRSKRVASGRPMRTTFNPAFTQPAVRLSTSNKKIQKISEFLGEFLRAFWENFEISWTRSRGCNVGVGAAKHGATPGGRPATNQQQGRGGFPRTGWPLNQGQTPRQKKNVFLKIGLFEGQKRNAKTCCNILKPCPISLFPMLNTSMQHDEPLQPSWQCLQPAASRALLCDSLHSSQLAVLR